MYAIDSAGNVANEWSNGSPPATSGTVLDATWMNMLQAEALAILTAAGIAPVKGTNNQIITAIQDLIAASKPAYKRDFIPALDESTLSAFLGATYYSVGVCYSSAGEICYEHVDPSGSYSTVLFSMVIDATAACTPAVVCAFADNALHLYLDGTLENSWTLGGGPSSYNLALSAGTHVVQFVLENTDSGSPTGVMLNDWMSGEPITWLRAARS